jgi:hypothetical protein
VDQNGNPSAHPAEQPLIGIPLFDRRKEKNEQAQDSDIRNNLIHDRSAQGSN